VPSSTASVSTANQTHSTRILLCFAAVYLFWGGTYLAMRFGVEVLPPFVLGSTRFLISGPLMLGFCLVRGISIRPTLRELGLLLAIAVLLLVGGNTTVIWVEQYLPTGLEALLVAAVPLYAALIEIFLPHGESLSLRGWTGIGIGLAGLLLLVWPGLRASLHGHHTQLIAIVVSLLGTFCWTSGSVLSRRSKLRLSGFAAAGWEMLFAGLVNAVIMLNTGGYHDSHWGMQAWASIAYLVVFGSLVTYTAYIYLLDHVAVPKVATYAYINPMIAVLLGALFLSERLARVEYAGMAAILIAVFLVTSSKLKSGKPAAEVELAAVEPQS
jgi:drug/metabolite transporter (DMT)-like permease